jgi:hypothetical protein
MKKQAASYLLILLAAALACAPLLLRGASCGHDFEFHFVSWLDAQASWRAGILYPHWAPSANYGAGEPRFVFYPPLTWMLGAALGLVLPWALVPAVLTFLLLAGTGLATRALARQALGQGAATLAGCAAIFTGYPLFTAYERTAFAELAGGVWAPLALLFALRQGGEELPLLRRALNRDAVALAVTVAAAWLSNPTAGVMICYLLAAVAVLQSLMMHSGAPAIRAAAGAGLGLGLIGFYLLPAAWERRWVEIENVLTDSGQTLENNWLFARHAGPDMELHDAVLRTVSWIAVGMVVATLLALLVCGLRRRLPGAGRWRWPLALIAPAVLFLQFSGSSLLWRLPEMRFLQFPWRWLLTLEAPLAIFAAAAVWPRAESRPWRRWAVSAATAAVFLALTLGAGAGLFQECEGDAVAAILVAHRSGAGFEGTWEYDPPGGDQEQIPTRLPDACLTRAPLTVLGQHYGKIQPEWRPGQPGCLAVFRAQGGAEHRSFDLHLTQPGSLVLRLSRYPAWRVAVNGRLVEAQSGRPDGLLEFPVPAGDVRVRVDWATTPDVVAGRALSVVALCLLLLLAFLSRRARPRLS